MCCDKGSCPGGGCAVDCIVLKGEAMRSGWMVHYQPLYMMLTCLLALKFSSTRVIPSNLGPWSGLSYRILRPATYFPEIDSRDDCFEAETLVAC